MELIGGATWRWTFDTVITSATDDVADLTVNGQTSVDLNSQDSPTSVLIDYDDPEPDPSPWAVTGPVGGLTFAGGRPLLPQSGVTT